jgi:hypothetical protein
MKKVFLSLGMMFLCFCPHASANSSVLLTFDNLSKGNYGNKFTYDGVTFETYPTSELEVTGPSPNDADGLGTAYSLPNKLSVVGAQPTSDPAQSSFTLLFNQPANNINFWLTGTFHNTTIDAYNSSSQLVSSYTQAYPQNGPPPAGFPGWDYYYDTTLNDINVNGSGISKLTIQPSAYDGFSIDNVSYHLNAAPEPVSTILFLVGGAIMLFIKRRQIKLN